MESLRASRVEIFESKPMIASPMSPISEVIGTLENNNAYEVFIQEGNKVSAITMREVLKASDISNMKASSIMFYVSKLSPDDTVGKAARLMSDYRLRALPIIRDKAIGGAVTAQSLCRSLLAAKEFRDLKINKVMKVDPITIGKNESVSKARRLMLKNDIDHLPVLDSGELCGILFSNHIVLSMLPSERISKGTIVSKPSGYFELKVSGLMDPDPLVCDPKETAVTVLRRMIEQDKTYSLVKLWHELQGIVTYRDFVFLLAEPEKIEIPVYMVGLPEDPFEAELARAKFMRGAKALCRSLPKIEEIRSKIKTKSISADRRRYEVNVSVISAGEVYTYSDEGWDLPSVFDSITNKTKKLLTKKRVRQRRKRMIPSPQ